MKAAGTRKKAPRRRRKAGGLRLVELRKAVNAAAIDGRSRLGRELSRWRRSLIEDLGGDSLSTQQLALVDVATRTKLMVDSIDAWILRQPSLVNARKRSLLPAVKERQTLADALARYLGQLGLERRAPKPMTLAEYLEAKKKPGETP